MRKILASIIFVLVLLSMITGALPQLQIFLLKGKIVIPSIAVKLFIVLVLYLSILSTCRLSIIKTKIRTSFLILSCVLFLFYLIFEMFNFGNRELSISYMFYSYNAYYFFILVIPLVFLLENSISHETISKYITIIAIPLAILGIVQFATNSTILPTSSSDGSFKILSYQFKNNIRAFSLFDAGLNFGHFLCIVLSLVVAKIKFKSSKLLINLLLFILLSIAVYSTMTRNIYIEYSSIIFAIIFLSMFIKKKFISLLPLFFYLVGTVINNIVPYITSKYVDNSIFDINSYLIRQMNWVSIKDAWLNNGIVSALFGTGLVQNDKINVVQSIIIDNSFIAVGLHIGIIGIILWLFIMWTCWMYCLKITRENFNYFNLAITVFFSTWLITGIFNLNLAIYPIIFILFVIANKVPTKTNKKHIVFNRTIQFM